MNPTDAVLKKFQRIIDDQRRRLKHPYPAFGKLSIRYDTLALVLASMRVDRDIVFRGSDIDYENMMILGIIRQMEKEAGVLNDEAATQALALVNGHVPIDKVDSRHTRRLGFSMYHAAIQNPALVPYLEAGVLDPRLAEACIDKGVSPDVATTLVS